MLKKSRIYSLYFFLVIMNFLLISTPQLPVVEGGYLVAQYEIDMPEKIPQAKVGDGDSGTVTYTGRINLIEYPPKRTSQIILTTRAYSPVNNDLWGAIVLPPQVILTPLQNSAEVTISVRAPMYEDVNEERNIVLTGTWQLIPSGLSGTIEDSGVFVRVAPFIKFIVFSEDPFKQVWPGDEVEYKITIVNYGNRNESFHISIPPADLDLLEKGGVAVSIPQDSIDIGPRSEGSIKVKVQGTVTRLHPWLSYMQTVKIRVTPMNPLPDDEEMEPEDYAREYSIFYYQVGISYPEPSICATVIIVIALIAGILYLKKKSDEKRKGKRRRRRRKPKVE